MLAGGVGGSVGESALGGVVVVSDAVLAWEWWLWVSAGWVVGVVLDAVLVCWLWVSFVWWVVVSDVVWVVLAGAGSE
jgi:hypothetical protein